MKLSSSLLPIALSSTVIAQRNGAEFKRIHTLRGASPDDANRTPSGSTTRILSDADDVKACGANKNRDGCNGKDLCTWCESEAVSSACYPSHLTDRLASSVFQCDGSGSSHDREAPGLAGESEPEKKPKVQTFNLKEGITLTMSSDVVDKDFCDGSSSGIAGYMSVQGSQFDTANDKHLFFWMKEKRSVSQIPKGNNVELAEGWNWPWESPGKDKPAPQPQPQPETKPDAAPASPVDDPNTPLIVWLTGGPGCSSSLALLTENGPCTVNEDGASTSVNPYSWTESAHVLWLDQPANVGYSYGQGNDTNEKMISEDAYYFLQAFFKSADGSKYKDSPLFIVGESYGGHYAPAIAHRIWRGNKDLKPGLLKLNLKGLGVGNGLTNPEIQYQHYSEMAFKNSHNLQVIDESTYNAMKQAEPVCVKGIQQCNAGDNTLDLFACQAAFVGCNTALTMPYRATGLNPYDITKECGSNPLCYDFSAVEKFMNADSTKKALHVADHNPSWQTCNMMVNMEFHVDWMKDFSPYVADLLNDGVPALIYAGDVDFICNYLGNKAWTYELEWKHKAEFQAAEDKDWNNKAGLSKTAYGLTFLQVFDAGHMVPSDQPAHALEMITQFIQGKSF
ncbi:hypothetical protein THAOC_17255 [Thalassiosira oceanica]|uniref:Carboxypeptidase n=1 Tax=Thalassiosira oceanica TaxID=159749 RepID=K0S7T1_THAOC|nr:hypothetical protein THAOC_17255 [Thalassiosira oceanica]|eukprot:EJK62148.1 hypothetical protein THAOC_17255 [Thalassiosira oceanica]